MPYYAIDEDLWLLDHEKTLTGVLRHGNRALLINAPHPEVAHLLRDAGLTGVDEVVLLHHRRELADGLSALLDAGKPAVIAPASERALFERPEDYWSSESSRWRLLCGHVPNHCTHVTPVRVAKGVSHGDVLTWHDWELQVVATPGYTDGSISLLVRRQGHTRWNAFIGDLMWGAGMIRDMHSLQHQTTRNGHRVGDYHGFMGAMETLLESLESLLGYDVARFIPAHGEVISRPSDAVELLRARFRVAYHNYAAISALRWYFPDFFRDHSVDSRALPMQETVARPANVMRLAGTTWALLAGNRRGLLIDPHSPEALEAAARALDSGEICAYDGVWLTHYHHDHVEAAQTARERFDIPVLADSHMADIVSRPDRHFLTCLSPMACEIDRATRDGETWQWHDTVLTAYHFPGQTLYHGGLHVCPAEGPRLFFAGDAVTPTGIDDYCSWNRNWLGEGVGFDRCLKLLRLLDPDIIFNQHVDVGFRFSSEAYELMLTTLSRRERLFRDLLPWDHANVGTDACWVHTYPYEQTAAAGSFVLVEVMATNHLERASDISIEPVLPPGWSAGAHKLGSRVEPKGTCRCRFHLRCDGTVNSGRFVIPFGVRVDDVYMGTIAEAVVDVTG